MSVYQSERAPLWQLRDDQRAERLCFPWRRLLARTADLLFYMLLFWTASYLVFRWNVLLLHWLPCGALMLAAGLVLMFALEPVLLALLGTTPGKALFGMRLCTPEGGKLSVAQGYVRIIRILSRGCGFVIIPGYNFVRMLKACKLCQVEGATEWDAGIVYACRGNFYLRIAAGVLSAVLAAVLLTAVYYGADMPPHRGQLTGSQLEENVDGYWRFHGTAWNTELFYTINLQFYESSAGYIFDRMDPPEVVVQETGGVVTGVGFEFTGAPRAVLLALPVWLRCYTVSFVGAQKDISFIDMHAPGGVLDRLLTPVDALIERREGTERIRFAAGGTEISLDITLGENVSAAFSLQKT